MTMRWVAAIAILAVPVVLYALYWAWRQRKLKPTGRGSRDEP